MVRLRYGCAVCIARTAGTAAAASACATGTGTGFIPPAFSELEVNDVYGRRNMAEMNSNPFAYHIIRYTPNLIRDEWVNIGVVLHDPASGKFRVRLIEEETEYARVRRLHPAANESLLRGIAPMLEDTLGEHRGDLAEWIAKLDRTLSNAVQFSPQTGLLADDLDAELDRLYSSHVAPPRAPASAGGVAETRSGIRAGANQVFRIAGLWPKLERSVRVDKYTYSGDPLRLDYSYRRNGT